jgi:hypothetical protein
MFHYHSSFSGLLEHAGQATNYAAVPIIAPLRCVLSTSLSGRIATEEAHLSVKMLYLEEAVRSSTYDSSSTILDKGWRCTEIKIS